MKKINILLSLSLLGLLLTQTSCFKDLDTLPIDPDEVTANVVYDNPESYKQALAKIYGGLALTGNQGPTNQPDLSGLNEGFAQYVRMLWYANELTTDEAVIGWNDATIKDFHEQDWDANDGFIQNMYNRVFYQISLANEYIRNTTDGVLDSRGVTGTLRDEVVVYRAEARFLRALSYWHALDMFRNVPFVTENDAVGSFFPQQIQGPALFDWIEGELKSIETILVPPRQNAYARADQACAWMLLAKLYMNAEVYTGTPKYAEAITYLTKVINAGYTLDEKHKNLFLADNNLSNEVIFPVAFDGKKTQTWGGTTFLVHAPVGGTMIPADYGVGSGWGGVRVTKSIVEKFPSVGSGSVLVSPNPGNTTYPVIYVPGGYQGWDPSNTSTVLASPGVDGRFSGYIYFKDDNTEFKFTEGPNWDVNYGDDGADGTLDQNGANIKAPVAGQYKLDVDLNSKTYTMLRTEWGLIGSATPDGWNSDQNMTYDAATNSWSIQLDLVAGEVKFRANDDWGLNYGDDGADALLEQNGANIAIPGSGNYRITLYLDKPDHTYKIELTSFDSRSQFYTDGQNLEINDVAVFTEGYAYSKFRNVTSTGIPGSDPEFPDTDFPMFRLADAYLMYAEAVLRGGGGSISDALNYVNAVRERAFGDASGNIDQAGLTLDFLLDERARELLWEGHRRTDLVRFGKFSDGDYLWAWKGGVKEGRTVSSTFNVFPIPASDIGANPTLVQNPGY